MLRGIVSLLLGGAVTYALFVFMAFLIGGGPTRHDASTESPIIEITMSKEDARTVHIGKSIPDMPGLEI